MKGHIMIDIKQLQEHSISAPLLFNYTHNVDNIITVCKQIENNGHVPVYMLLDFEDGKALDITCHRCGGWVVYNKLHLINFIGTRTAGFGTDNNKCITIH